MNISFIGAGKVGCSLGKYFLNKGVKIKGYYSRTTRSAYEASEFTNSLAYDKLRDLIDNSDTIFITVPDDSISDIWQKISSLNLKDKIICHTSGSVSSEIFSNINNSGAFGYSIHPMFPFSDKFNSYKYLENAYFSIEGSVKYLNYLCSFFENLGNRVIKIDSSKKSTYHLANVVVSNLVLSLLDLGCSYLEECNINKEDAIKALFPLIQGNIDNIRKKGFVNSVTGPIERCDLGTVKSHVKVVKSEDLELYRLLSKNLLELSKVKNSGRDYKELEEYLQGGF